MDIKPENILVKRLPGAIFPDSPYYRVYLCDFGISEMFFDSEDSQTETFSGMTRRYCAPEVHHYASHGTAADIFSLGCVFVEIATTLTRLSLDELKDYLRGDNLTDELDDDAETEPVPYHSAVLKTMLWVEKLQEAQDYVWLLCSNAWG